MSEGETAFLRERAKRLCAAMQSMSLGTAYATEYKRIGDGPIGNFWYQWAERIEAAQTDAMSALYTEITKPPTMQ